MNSNFNPPFLGTRSSNSVGTQEWAFASGNLAALTGVSILLCTLKASAANPILYSARLITVTANTASGAVTGSLGTASAGTQIINATSLKATAGTNILPSPLWVYAVADVAIWHTFTVASGTDAAGLYTVELLCRQFNINGYVSGELA